MCNAANLVHGVYHLTIQEVNSIKIGISSHFSMYATYGDVCNGKASPCRMGDTMGALVRLVFHDSAGGALGPNGCIDFIHTDANRGLEEVISSLDDLYFSSFSAIVSRADFWVSCFRTIEMCFLMN